MDSRNLSDLIEAYLKNILEKKHEIEIRRSEMANLFDCVPSQINYVIKTRFTIPQGYRVESKRGGGGYIKIVKIELQKNCDYLRYLGNSIKSEITEYDANSILEQLNRNNLIDRRELELIKIFFSNKSILSVDDNNQLRSRMVIDLLERLTYEEKE